MTRIARNNISTRLFSSKGHKSKFSVKAKLASHAHCKTIACALWRNISRLSDPLYQFHWRGLRERWVRWGWGVVGALIPVPSVRSMPGCRRLGEIRLCSVPVPVTVTFGLVVLSPLVDVAGKNTQWLWPFYAFYAFYAWWIYFPQSGALGDSNSLSVLEKIFSGNQRAVCSV